VASAEQPAALMSFQRITPDLLLTKNVDSAPRSLTSACHFSGNYAISAAIAVKTATFASF